MNNTETSLIKKNHDRGEKISACLVILMTKNQEKRGKEGRNKEKNENNER